MKKWDIDVLDIIIVLAIIKWGFSLNTYTHDMFRPFKDTGRLIVNRENKYRSVVPKTEMQGIKDLEYLANTSEYEEEWVFLPKKMLWEEIGFKEIFKKDNYGFPTSLRVASYTPYTKKLMKKNEEIIFYHIHPKKGYDKIGQDIQTEIKTLEDGLKEFEDLKSSYEEQINKRLALTQEYKKAIQERKHLIAEINYNNINQDKTLKDGIKSLEDGLKELESGFKKLESMTYESKKNLQATMESIQEEKDSLIEINLIRFKLISGLVSYSPIPSNLDLESMLLRFFEFKNYQQKGNIAFKIVSPYGITQYNLTRAGKKHFENKKKSYIKKWVKKHIKKFAELQDELELNEKIESEEEAYSEGIKQAKKFSELMSNEHILIEFSPFK